MPPLDVWIEAAAWPRHLFADIAIARHVREHNERAAAWRGHEAALVAVASVLGAEQDDPRSREALLDDLTVALDEALAAGDPYAPTGDRFVAAFSDVADAARALLEAGVAPGLVPHWLPSSPLGANALLPTTPDVSDGTEGLHR